MKTIDPLQIQRLVDGELSLDERIAIVSECDVAPASWRLVALRFMEEQQFARSMSQLSVVGLDELHQAGAPAVQVKHLHVASLKQKAQSWLALAACILILLAGTWIGYSVRPVENALKPALKTDSVIDLVSTAPTLDIASDSEEVTSPKVAVSNAPQLVGYLRVPSGEGQGEYMEIPVMETSQLNPHLMMGDVEPIRRLDSKLREQGWSIDYQADLLGSELPDGRQLILPVGKVRLIPCSL